MIDCVDPAQEYTNFINLVRERLCWGEKMVSHFYQGSKMSPLHPISL